MNTGNRQSFTKLDEETEGHLLLTKSLGEILAENGEKMITINIGSEGNAYLNNHKAEKNGGLVIHPGFSQYQKKRKKT